ncbi:MAG: YihY/virulence factor BrkB family protein [Bacteroidales bacterium]|jgi:membrane protein|nr:YihY/virulence factor BrkB family protein [Bacteroidales bacterium]
MKVASKISDLFTDRIWTLDTSGCSAAYAETVRIVKLIRITFGTFTENRMGFQCVALSYFITLALVPFIAFAFAVTGGLGLDDRITEVLRMALPSHPEIATILSERAGNILASAQGGGLGLVSALFFLWAILWMMFQVERVFNNVWGILKIPRKIYKRFGFYFLVLFLSPFIVVIFGTGLVYSTNLPNLYGIDLQQVRFLVKLLGYVIFYLIVVATLSVMYKYIPATRVQYKYAFRSALVAGIIFMLFQYLYLRTQMFVGRLNQAYGILAAIPLFLIWLNFSWQIIIYGAQLTYSFQNVDQYRASDWDAENRS